MYDSMRTAAGAAPLSTTVQASGPHDSRGAARLLQQAALHASEPPQHSGISPLVWKMSNPQHRASLLRQHHFKGIFGRRKSILSALSAASQGTASPASATQGQAAPALGLWRHHGLFRLAHHSGLLGHTAHGGWLHKLTAAVHVAAAQSAQPAASAPGTAAQSTSASATPLAHGAQSAAEAASLANITQQFQSRFAQSAKDPAAFAALLKQAFGDHYDAAKAEGIRQQTLAGDFFWMPKVQLASASQLKDTSGTQGEGVARGCYSAGDDTIYLNRDLLASDPAQAEKILAEEMGHALDARLNTSDAAGDEGDIFSKLVHGQTISASQLAEMKADNDHGVIEINGKKTEVEYGWFKKLRKAISGGIKKVFKAVTNGIKQGLQAAAHVAQGLVTLNFDKVKQGLEEGVDAVKDTAKNVAKAVKDTAKAIHKIVKEAALKLMQSKLFNAILMVAHFIPAINVVALAIDAAKAAYMVYQGVKYKSLSMVLAGVASLATAASGISANYGFNNLAGTLTKVGNWAGQASQAYNAIAKKDIGAALGMMGLKPAQQVYSVVQAARHGDTLGALGTVADIGEKLTGSQTWHQAGQVLQGAQAVQALHEGNYDSAQNLAGGLDLAQEAQAQSNADAAQARAQAAQAAAQGSEGSASGADEEGSQPPADPKAKLREMEQDFRQSTDEGASSVSVRQDDRGLYGTALRAASGNAQDALVLLGLWKQDGLTLNDNGSPITKEGDKLRTTDVSRLSAEQRQALQREGARVLRTNSVTMERNREAQAAKKEEANYKQALSELSVLSTGLRPPSSSAPQRSSSPDAALPPVENLYTPVEGVMQQRYRDAVAGLTDPNASALDKVVYTTLGAAVLPLSLVEGVATGVINAPNAAARTGQHLAAADLATEPSDRVANRLAAVSEGAEAFTGLGGLATLGGGAPRLEPRSARFEPPGNALDRTHFSDDLTSHKLTFDNSLSPADKVTAIEVGKALADNPIASAFYSRLQRQGTEVRFVSDAPSDLLGLYDGNKNTVTINIGAHTSSNEAVSTIVHEATHQNRFIEKGISLGTQAEEYVAFRNELFFQTGKRPSLLVRQQLIDDVVKPLYPELPEGKLPKLGAKP